MTQTLRWVRSTINQAGFAVGEEKLVDIGNEIIEGFIQTGVLVLLDGDLPAVEAASPEEPEFMATETLVVEEPAEEEVEPPAPEEISEPWSVEHDGPEGPEPGEILKIE